MITLQELNPKNVPLTPTLEANLKAYLEKINKFRAAYARPMICTSGLRSLEDHKRIYREKAKGNATYRIPMGSKHLSAQAADFADPDGKLMQFCKDNVPLLEAIGLWIEEGTVGWVHLQSVPPGSGRRFFKP